MTDVQALIESIKKRYQSLQPDQQEQLAAELQSIAEENCQECEASLITLVDSIQDDIWSIGTDYTIKIANASFRKTFLAAYGIKIRPGNPALDGMPDSDRPLWKERYDRALNGETHTLVDQILINGSIQYLEMTFAPVLVGEQIVGVACHSKNFTDQKDAEEELQRANEKLIVWVDELQRRNRTADILHQMDDLLQVCDTPEEAYSVVHQFGPELFPLTSGVLYQISSSRRAVEAMVVWGDLSSERVFAPEECWALRRGQVHLVAASSAGLRCRHMDAVFQGDYIGFPMMASGETTGLFHIETLEPDLFTSEVQELIRSVGERISLTLSNINLREKLRAQSTRDPLTGLFNRRYMEESLQRELSRARRKQSTVAVIMLDIDHFKKFNDMFGHDAGDAVLVQMGALLRTHIRSEDIACRYGGEEFMLILPDASLEVTRERAERILELVHNMQVIYHKESLGTVTVSAGVAAFPIHSQLSDEVLKAADQALYQAKSKGRNCVEVAPVPAV